MEQQLAGLQRQIAELEQRFMAKESGQFEILDRLVRELSQQMAQVAVQADRRPAAETPSRPQPKPQPVTPEPSQPVEVDPEIERLKAIIPLDDF
jgi:hypothetical protein